MTRLRRVVLLLAAVALCGFLVRDWSPPHAPTEAPLVATPRPTVDRETEAPEPKPRAPVRYAPDAAAGAGPHEPLYELPGWSGTECMQGALLRDPRVAKGCTAGSVDPQFCRAMREEQRRGKVPCAYHTAGSFHGELSAAAIDGAGRHAPPCALSVLNDALPPGAVRFVSPDGAVSRHDARIARAVAAARRGGVSPQAGEEQFRTTAPLKDVVGHAEAAHGRVSNRTLLRMPHCPGLGAGLFATKADPVLGNATTPLSRAALVASLRRASGHGRGAVLFSGDSMLRQLMLRLVARIRGQELLAERYFHADAAYALWPDGDELVFLAPTAAQVAAKSPRTAAAVARAFPEYFSSAARRGEPFEAPAAPPPDGEADDPPLLLLVFCWDARPRQYRRELLAYDPVRTPPRLHVTGFMYWWQNKDPLADIEPYLAAVERRHAAMRAAATASGRAAGRLRFVYLTTPPTAPGTVGGVEPDNLAARNRRLLRWLKESPLRTADLLAGGANAEPADEDRSGGAVWRGVVDYASLAAAGAFGKATDGLHYMCIWRPKPPKMVSEQKRNGERCRDPMNLAVAEYLAALLDAQALPAV